MIEYLNDQGIKTDKWTYYCHNKKWSGIPKHLRTHTYRVDPPTDMCRLYIRDDIIKLYGLLGFEIKVNVSDPRSFEIVEETLRGMYIWMKNIRPEWAEGFIDESARLCGGTDIGDG